MPRNISVTQLVVCSLCFVLAALWVVLILNLVLIPRDVPILSIPYWVSFIPAVFLVVLGVVAIADKESLIGNDLNNYNNYWDLTDHE